MGFDSEIEEYRRQREHALGMGGPKKLAARAAEGVLNARQRIDHLIDPESFAEAGLFATSERAIDRDKTPTDGYVTGFGRIDGREVTVTAADLTVKGASSTHLNFRKVHYARDIAARNGLPYIFMGECAGARVPDTMGARGQGGFGEIFQVARHRENPCLGAILGPSFGGSSWYNSISDLVVMRKGATYAVSSPKVTTVATSEDIDFEELGGWRLHAEVTGLVDLFGDSDEEVLDLVRRLLGYLPDHANQAPPIAPVPAGSDEGSQRLPEVLPDGPNQVYDVRKVLAAIVDKDSLLSLKDRFGRPLVTALARLGGRSVGILASNPMFKGGALDADCCDKAISFLVLCDSFNIPVVMMADTPGFLIGGTAERQRIPGKIMNWMQALGLVTVPKISVIMRKSYGQAYINMGGGQSDSLAAWISADIGFVDPAVGVNIVHGVRREDEPERFAELHAQVSRDSSAYDLGAAFLAHEVIEPGETRRYLIRQLEIHNRALTGGIGEHLMRTWPTSY